MVIYIIKTELPFSTVWKHEYQYKWELFGNIDNISDNFPTNYGSQISDGLPTKHSSVTFVGKKLSVICRKLFRPTKIAEIVDVRKNRRQRLSDISDDCFRRKFLMLLSVGNFRRPVFIGNFRRTFFVKNLVASVFRRI